MDNVFFLTLLFIFLTALISTYISRRSGDLCLKDLDGFHVTIELKDGRIVWGTLAVFSNGIEVLYNLPHRDTQGHVETSAILLGNQLDNIQTIYRYHDELSDKNKEVRQLEIVRTHHPGLHRQLSRVLRSFLNTFRDALNESIGFIISSAKQKGGSTIVQTQDKRLTQIGQTVLGAASNAYEPILERYIGRRVVVEEFRGENLYVEHPGILKEYTAQWMELLDCRLTQEHIFDLSEPERMKVNRNLDFIITKQQSDKANFLLRVENHGEETLFIKRFEAADYSQTVDAKLVPDDSLTLDLTDLPKELFEGINLSDFPDEVALRAEANPASDFSMEVPTLPSLRLVVDAIRNGDLCLPRPHAFIRHGVEAPAKGWLKESWADFKPWIRAHPWQTLIRLLWTVFNLLISALAGWALSAGLGGGPATNVVVAVVAGVVNGAWWIIQWSIVISGDEEAFAQRLKYRLSLLTIMLILVIGQFIWVLWQAI